MQNLLAKIAAVIALLMGLVGIAGCNTLDFSISFPAVDGLKQGDQVLLDNSVIGTVGTITYTSDASFLVGVKISKEHKNSVFQESQFFIEASPLKPEEKAIIVLSPPETSQEPRQKIESDVTVQGSVKEPWHTQTLESFWQAVEETVLEVLKRVDKIPETEQYQVFKEKLSELESQMKSSGSQAKEKISKEILPQLEKKIKSLMEKLESQGEKEKARSLDQDLKRLQSI